MENIKNVPEYANNKRYIVARISSGELWFWGAWDEKEEAYNVAVEVGGAVIVNEGGVIHG